MILWDSSSTLKVSGVCKRFGTFAALTDVSFELRTGEVLGLIGPNGAGKTTLFECLAGVLPTDDGVVCIRDWQMTRSERASVLFYLPDGVAPWSAQPVGWVLDFAIGFFGGDRSLRGELVEQLDLKRLLHQSLGTGVSCPHVGLPFGGF